MTKKLFLLWRTWFMDPLRRWIIEGAEEELLYLHTQVRNKTLLRWWIRADEWIIRHFQSKLSA
jgi:hypothetical protein